MRDAELVDMAVEGIGDAAYVLPDAEIVERPVVGAVDIGSQVTIEDTKTRNEGPSLWEATRSSTSSDDEIS